MMIDLSGIEIFKQPNGDYTVDTPEHIYFNLGDAEIYNQVVNKYCDMLIDQAAPFSSFLTEYADSYDRDEFLKLQLDTGYLTGRLLEVKVNAQIADT